MSKASDLTGEKKYSSRGSITNYTDMVISEEEYGLTFSQQIKIQNLTKKRIRSFIMDVVHPVTGNPKLDNRSPETKKIQAYSAKLKRQEFYYAFTIDELEFIEKNINKMTPTEMTRVLFKNLQSRNAHASKQGKAMAKYSKALKKRMMRTSLSGQQKLDFFEDPTKLDLDIDFTPPRTFEELCMAVNATDVNAKYNPKELTKEQKKNLTSLKGYLQSTRFLITISSAPTTVYKKVLFNEFIRATYEKNDLTPDELNGYITLCDLYGQETETKKHINLLNELIEINAEDDDPKMRMSIVEALSSKTKELNDISNRQNVLIKSLSGTRTDRLKAQTEIGESLILFVNKWKEEEYRKTNLRIQEARKLELEKEKKKFDHYDDLIAEIVGIQEEEILDI